MDYEFIKTRLAPCGLHCGKCFSFNEGEIGRLSKELLQSLGNFDIYAERFVSMLNEPIFAKYPDFKEMLSLFSKGKCKGCRNERCILFKNCNVRECSEDKAVDFCFECPDFPCENSGFDSHLQKRWIKINIEMREGGVETYYNRIKDSPRY